MKSLLSKLLISPDRLNPGAVKRALVRLHRDERGAEGLEKLLIVAAIVLPLLGVLIFFRNEISDWVKTRFDEVKDDADANPIDGTPTP